VPLRLVPEQMAVWRGPQLLTLDRQPFELLRKLFDLQGQPAPEALLQIAGTQANLNTLIGRIRKIIEPIAKTNIYIQNKRDLGYWLENFA
jgi:DNA-binding response OmpR family regulator